MRYSTLIFTTTQEKRPNTMRLTILLSTHLRTYELSLGIALGWEGRKKWREGHTRHENHSYCCDYPPSQTHYPRAHTAHKQDKLLIIISSWQSYIHFLHQLFKVQIVNFACQRHISVLKVLKTCK